MTAKEKQNRLAKEANKAVCALHDFNCDNEYQGDKTLLTDEERKVLRAAHDIAIKIINNNN